MLRFIMIISCVVIVSPLLVAQPESNDDFPPPPNFDETEFSDFPGSINPPGFGSGGMPTPQNVTDPDFSTSPRNNSPLKNPESKVLRPSAQGGSPTAKNTGAQGGEERGVLTKEKKQKLSEAELEEISDDAYPELIDSFDFPNAEIKDVVKAISELTGKNFIIDPGVGGKITILAPSRITVAEAYKAFLSALAVNGLAVVPSGKFLKIRMARNAQRDGIETYSGAYYPNFDQLITRVISLKHLSAEVIHRELKTLASKDGEMTVHTPTNSIIISDYGSNIDRLMKVIAQLDVPGFEDQLAVIPIKYAKAKDIAELVNKIVNKGETQRSQGVGGAFSSGLPRFGRSTSDSRGQGSPYFMVIPDDRSNSLVVVGNKAGIERVQSLLKQLDFPIRPEDSGGVYVYYVKYGDAEKIAQTLGVIAKEAAPTQGGQSSTQVVVSPTAGVQVPTQAIFGGNIKINPDKNTNSLVILASKQDYDLILNLLRRLDIPRDQVYVESIIMEMKANDSLDWQIGYFKFDESGSGAKAGFNGMKPETLGGILGSPSGGNGAILGFGSKNTITVTPPVPGAQPYKIASLIGFVNFLKTYSNANVLSTPQLLVMDNQEGEISVGDRVVAGQNIVVSAQGPSQGNLIFEDVTISLKIKPFISPSINSVRLELQSQVNQLSTAKTPPGLVNVAQPIATRKIKTNIVVPNRDTAVLGGLIKEDDIETVQKVPLLGDIPIIGWLFRSRGISKEKTNLLVFLTPHIIRTESDSRNMLGRKLNERMKFIKSMGGRDPYGKKIDEISASQAEASAQDITRDEERSLTTPQENPVDSTNSGDFKEPLREATP